MKNARTHKQLLALAHKSPLVAFLLADIDEAGLPKPVEEYRFAAPRRWRFDLAYVEQKIAIECEGGVWIRGRHVRAKGFQADCEKYNTAATLGWTVLRFTANDIYFPMGGYAASCPTIAIRTIRRAFERKERDHL